MLTREQSNLHMQQSPYSRLVEVIRCATKSTTNTPTIHSTSHTKRNIKRRRYSNDIYSDDEEKTLNVEEEDIATSNIQGYIQAFQWFLDLFNSDLYVLIDIFWHEGRIEINQNVRFIISTYADLDMNCSDKVLILLRQLLGMIYKVLKDKNIHQAHLFSNEVAQSLKRCGNYEIKFQNLHPTSLVYDVCLSLLRKYNSELVADIQCPESLAKVVLCYFYLLPQFSTYVESLHKESVRHSRVTHPKTELQKKLLKAMRTNRKGENQLHKVIIYISINHPLHTHLFE